MAADIGGGASRKLNACHMATSPTREEDEWAELTVDGLITEMEKSNMSKSALSAIASQLAKDIVCQMPREEFREVAEYTYSRVDEELDNLIGWGRSHTVAGAAYPKEFLALDLYDTDEEDDQSIPMLEEELSTVATFGSELLNFRGAQRSRQSNSNKLQGDNSGMRWNRMNRDWGMRSYGRPQSNSRSYSLERQSNTLDDLHCEETAAMRVLEAGGLRDEHKLKLQTELLPAVFSAWLAPVFEELIESSPKKSSTPSDSEYSEGYSIYGRISDSSTPSYTSASRGTSEGTSELGSIRTDIEQSAGDYRTRSAHYPSQEGSSSSSIHSFYHNVANNKLESDAFKRMKIVCCDGHGLKVVKHNDKGGKALRILKLDPVKNELIYRTYRKTGGNSIPCKDIIHVLREDNVTYIWYIKNSRYQSHKKAVGFELQREYDARILQLAIMHIMKNHSG